MSYQGKKIAGVWIDHRHAYVISTPDRAHTGEYSIIKKMEAQHHSDHSSSENAHNHKLATETHKLYESVSSVIQDVDSIFLTGPGTAQEEFQNYLKKEHAFGGKEISIGTSDHPTDNQKIAEIRKHFEV
jgi:stalled ribosome rescue protein Dom34